MAERQMKFLHYFSLVGFLELLEELSRLLLFTFESKRGFLMEPLDVQTTISANCRTAASLYNGRGHFLGMRSNVLVYEISRRKVTQTSDALYLRRDGEWRVCGDARSGASLSDFLSAGWQELKEDDVQPSVVTAEPLPAVT